VQAALIRDDKSLALYRENLRRALIFWRAHLRRLSIIDAVGQQSIDNQLIVRVQSTMPIRQTSGLIM